MRAVLLAALAAAAAAFAVTAATPALATPGYANCDQAKANGDTNIPSSSPNYRAGLDRDHDGIACETGNGGEEQMNQVGDVPRGSVDTGDGSTAGR